VRLKDLGEFGLIDLIAQRAGGPLPPTIIKGIGDDAAVLSGPGRDCLLLTTDILYESIHFQRGFASPYLLGKKSLAVNVSDIAAMGGTPLCYCVALAAPASTPAAFVRELYRGMQACARQHKLHLVGGDTSAAPNLISLAITVLGRAPRRQVVFRSGARRGDLIYVSGCLGDAALGLRLLQQQRAVPGTRSLVRKHLDPEPRAALGRQLARLGLASSMIDISDGLLADLRHILDASRAGARIRLPFLPLSGSYRKHCRQLAEAFYQPALCGGEDYELLFTISQGDFEKISKINDISVIGHITDENSGCFLVSNDGALVEITAQGFNHMR